MEYESTDRKDQAPDPAVARATGGGEIHPDPNTGDEITPHPTTYRAQENLFDSLTLQAMTAMRTIGVTRPKNMLRHYGLAAVVDGLLELRFALSRGETIRNRGGYFYDVVNKYHAVELPEETDWLADFASDDALASMIRREKYSRTPWG